MCTTPRTSTSLLLLPPSASSLPPRISNYVAVSNIKTAEGEDSIDNILEEMAGQQGITLTSSVPSSSSTSTFNSQNVVPLLTATPETVPAMSMTTPAAAATTTIETTTTETGDNIINDDADTSTTTMNQLLSTTIPTRPYTKQQLDRIKSWNRIMNTWQRTGTFPNQGILANGSDNTTFVPSFDVEMTRHFKVQALSSYLLENCKGLKMPAFERW
jgi:hypothetical protein